MLGERGEHLQAGGGEPAGAEDREPLRQAGSGSGCSAQSVRRRRRAARRAAACRGGRAAGATARPASAGRRRGASRRRARRARPPRRAASPAGPGRTRRRAAPAGSRPRAGGPCRRRRCRGAGRASGTTARVGTEASMTSSSGQTARSGAHRSTASACSGDGRLHRLVEQRAGPREVDVGADAVAVLRAEDVGQPLRQPPLDALGGHGDDLAARTGRRGASASTSASPRASVAPSADRCTTSTAAHPLTRRQQREREGTRPVRQRGESVGQVPGGQKNSSALLSGSRNDTPDPYGASLMPPWLMPSSSRRFAQVSSSARVATPKLTWSRPSRCSSNRSPAGGASGCVCTPNSVSPSLKTAWWKSSRCPRRAPARRRTVAGTRGR